MVRLKTFKAASDMDTAHLPPPAPPGTMAPRTRPTPIPQHAAIPIIRPPPIQETNPTAGAPPPGAQGGETPPMFYEEDGPPATSSGGQGDNPSDGEEKWCPVQETDPAPQALHGPQETEQRDEQSTHMDLAED